MPDLDQFFAEMRQTEGSCADDCVRILTDSGGAYTDVYCRHELKLPVPENRRKTYYLADCPLEYRELFEKSGRSFIAFEVTGAIRADMLDTFQSNVDYAIWIGHIEYRPARVLPLCLSFHPIYILLYIGSPVAPADITFSFRKHYLATDIRRSIMRHLNPEGITDGEILYAWGMAAPRVSDGDGGGPSAPQP